MVFPSRTLRLVYARIIIHLPKPPERLDAGRALCPALRRASCARIVAGVSRQCASAARKVAGVSRGRAGSARKVAEVSREYLAL